MVDLLQRGSDWLESMRRTHSKRSVTYARGALSVEVSTTVGKTVFRLDKGYGVTERVESRDFLVSAEDLVLGGVLSLPEAGDVIREVGEGAVYVYEVLAPGGEPCWRWSDPYRKTLRVHTKHVGTEAIP